eukprot:CAMPEP_0115127412 /NCGR_PEP_ID=MMETSP0227-20121206/50367_1 /TAXON_ID=89957 /ORGANISM="Polarella glacialis, Strain CCMP 1383" /LENGTH=1037 /DNA_ID=CAMNT_0002531459 /DNA_START=210 /DNA_END=3323 /DNA_ORIENTATION=+
MGATGSTEMGNEQSAAQGMSAELARTALQERQKLSIAAEGAPPYSVEALQNLLQPPPVPAPGGAVAKSPTGPASSPVPAADSPSELAAQSKEILNEPVLLSQLVQLLGSRPKHSLLLSDLGALLPGPLRHGVKEKGGLRSWLQKYNGLFLVSGQPGKESVTLILGVSNSWPDQAPLAPQPVGKLDQVASGFVPAGLVSAELETARMEEQQDNEAAVQLRGLPYRATMQDVKRFLSGHAVNLKDDNSIQLVLNRDGRPSGFGRIQFNCPAAAKVARDELHNKVMEVAGAPIQSMGDKDRYVEIFLYSERPNKLRFKKVAGDPEDEQVEDESLGSCKAHVIEECRQHMRMPGKGQLLLSMLGVALSPQSRMYLKKTDQGLKHFLAQFPEEFSVDGTKGRECITFFPAMQNGDQGDLPQGYFAEEKAAAVAAPQIKAAPTPAVAKHAAPFTPAKAPAAPEQRATRFSQPSWADVSPSSPVPCWPGAGAQSPVLQNGPCSVGSAVGRRVSESAPAPSRSILRTPGADTIVEDYPVPQSPKPTPMGLFDDTPHGQGMQTPSDWGTPQQFDIGWELPNHRKAAAAASATGAAAASAAAAAAGMPPSHFDNWAAWGLPPSGSFWDNPNLAAMAAAERAQAQALMDSQSAFAWGAFHNRNIQEAACAAAGDEANAEAARMAAMLNAMAGQGHARLPTPGMVSPLNNLNALESLTAALSQSSAITQQLMAASRAAQEANELSQPMAPAMQRLFEAQAHRQGGKPPEPHKASFAPQGKQAVASAATQDREQTPAVRLRGLPYEASEQDILSWFSKYDVVDHIDDVKQAVRIYLKPNGKPMGIAVISMRSREAAAATLQALSGQMMGSRYIEVFQHTEGEAGTDKGIVASSWSSSAAAAAVPTSPGPSPFTGASDTGSGWGDSALTPGGPMGLGLGKSPADFLHGELYPPTPNMWDRGSPYSPLGPLGLQNWFAGGLPPGMPPPGTLPASCGYLNSLQGLSGPQGFPPAPLDLTPAGEEPKWEKLFDFLGQPAPPHSSAIRDAESTAA